MKDHLYEQGMHTRRAVLGDDYVDHAEAVKTEFDADFQEGEVWVSGIVDGGLVVIRHSGNKW